MIDQTGFEFFLYSNFLLLNTNVWQRQRVGLGKCWLLRLRGNLLLLFQNNFKLWIKKFMYTWNPVEILNFSTRFVAMLSLLLCCFDFGLQNWFWYIYFNGVFLKSGTFFALLTA